MGVSSESPFARQMEFEDSLEDELTMLQGASRQSQESRARPPLQGFLSPAHSGKGHCVWMVEINSSRERAWKQPETHLFAILRSAASNIRGISGLIGSKYAFSNGSPKIRIAV